ncbi:auxin response factor 6-like [Miscanthus floridulus]|uniref:auxin response factor 6-like n=1 Tax=Miscanthus floridulus TaxID=154761 RepID=UPI00345A336C
MRLSSSSGSVLPALLGSPEAVEEHKCLNSELWHACAGPLVSLPAVGSRVVYFPQGHTEQVAASTNKEMESQIPNYPNLPPQPICQLHNVTMHADAETDEVYTQMTLQPLNPIDLQSQTGPNGPAGSLIHILIGDAQPTMAGGPLSHCAINRDEGRRLKSRGSPEPSFPPTNPKPDLVRGAASDGKHLRHSTAPPPDRVTGLRCLHRRSPPRITDAVFTDRRCPTTDTDFMADASRSSSVVSGPTRSSTPPLFVSRYTSRYFRAHDSIQ